MSWLIEFTRPAHKDLRDVPQRDREAIFDALDRLAIDPYNADIRKLAGRSGEWRLRVGQWRVRFILHSSTNTVEILHVLPRGRAYRQ